jgi:hypothetical protein
MFLDFSMKIHFFEKHTLLVVPANKFSKEANDFYQNIIKLNRNNVSLRKLKFLHRKKKLKSKKILPFDCQSDLEFFIQPR